ncbi:DNA cytosine methyltransferase [Burkholderia thailandensis]|uniref:DNA cytosine methyltransferase n=1 Tax=Burkholderia thailandensis TaxID=57975 RepID=UPI00217E3B08|nr:DNA cytosine methyltransferase [Burkholderia thailandensis]MCS6455982.1 DNA cytosine methyltransferase [Burkholderia thailandensis]MCS6482697.1 DNA cytosine methyltransferase [Burkholderia thailandensis]
MQWLRNLIAAGHIAPGDVDERSIEDVRPDDLRVYDQCHFFAGIGVWSHALRRAGWPDDRPVWTGSCPCQPFSSAGKGAGFDDERHLWPAWYWLIGECRPPVIFGEQVASSAVEPWIDLVRADMEALDYPFGCVPFPSAGVGSPHIRDRAYWMAYAARERRARISGRRQNRIAEHREAGRLAHSNRMPSGRDSGAVLRTEATRDRARLEDGREPDGSWNGCATVGLADADGRDASAERQQHGGEQRFLAQDGSPVREADQRARNRVPGNCTGAGPTNGVWRDADWLLCRDGKWRPVEPGTFPLVDGAPSRVGRLRAYGNAINAEAATQFILAAQDILTT